MSVIENFGRNVRFTPAHCYAPRDDEAVLAILDRHRGEPIRCRGALHSWSGILGTEGILLDMRHFDVVQVTHTGTGRLRRGARARLGAGCTVARALDLLQEEGLTLPTVGAVTRQTVAGAISTATHGSGAPSLSHFVEEVRVAAYDPTTGEPCIRHFASGDELRAARCALGGLGVILDVVIRTRAVYRVRERVEKTGSIDDVLAGADQWPLQQFVLMPWQWRYVVYRRRCARDRGSPLANLLVRAYLWMYIDRFQHAAVWALVRLARRQRAWLIRFFLRHLARIANHRRVDDSRRVLTLRHDLFRHVEMEIFVPESRLKAAAEDIRGLVELAGGQNTEAAIRVAAALAPKEADSLRGCWTHHYPISFRRVLADDALISMTSGGPAWISIGFFTYLLPVTPGFAHFARLVGEWFVARHAARLHWGKYFPHSFDAAIRSYSGFRRFEDVRMRYDRAGVFWKTNL